MDGSYVLWEYYIFLTFVCFRLLEICKNSIAPDGQSRTTRLVAHESQRFKGATDDDRMQL